MSANDINTAVDQADQLDGSVLSVVGSILRWLGIAIVLVGGVLAAGQPSVLPTDFAIVLASGAVVLWASVYFELQALRDQLGLGSAQRIRVHLQDNDE